MPKFLTIEQAAEVLQLSNEKVRELCKSGDIKAVNVGSDQRQIFRIPVSALESIG